MTCLNVATARLNTTEIKDQCGTAILLTTASNSNGALCVTAVAEYKD